MGGRKRQDVRVVMGVGYGLTLAALSFLLMGFGRGTYLLPLAISSAPLAVIEYPPPFTFFIGLGERKRTSAS